MARKTKTKAKVDRTEHAPAPTQAEYSGFQQAFDHFNRELFAGQLPPPLFTLQRKANSMGYFSANRFMSRAGKATVSEIGLNPDGFIGQTDEQIMQTVVHEMVHAWQEVFGKPSRRGYHNKEWAAKMKVVGLYPSSTGMVGRKETGQRMSDYPIPGGAFQIAYGKLAATGFKLNWQSSVRSTKENGPNSKTKFTCGQCSQNAWGKPDLQIRCNVCDIEMLAVDRTTQDEPLANAA
jgi:hypothetical protein